jgi:hypothetical protein
LGRRTGAPRPPHTRSAGISPVAGSLPRDLQLVFGEN